MTDTAAAPPPARIDGRHARKAENRARLLETTRALMRAGHFQPTMIEACRAADMSQRSGFEHFASVDGLKREAIEDEGVRQAIVNRIAPFPDVDHRDQVVWAAVFGRPMTPKDGA